MKYTVKDYLDLNQIADSGQCFRWQKIEDYHYHIIANNDILDIKQQDNILTLDCTTNRFYDYWYSYLDLDTDYSKISKLVQDDPFLLTAERESRGVRILQQEPFETLISFIISQQKTIPNIKTIVNNIAHLRGDLLDKTYNYYAFPSIDRLAAIDDEELDSLKLGYRKKYIRNTLDKLSTGKERFFGAKNLEDKKLQKYLMDFNGVGIKVASCTMLYGFHRLNAFPVDTWIKKVIDNEYNSSFDLDTYYPYNGVIQQYMFNYYRNKKQ